MSVPGVRSVESIFLELWLAYKYACIQVYREFLGISGEGQGGSA
jgi:hypothetical protein